MFSYMKNENKHSEMIDIMHTLHKYVPISSEDFTDKTPSSDSTSVASASQPLSETTITSQDSACQLPITSGMSQFNVSNSLALTTCTLVSLSLSHSDTHTHTLSLSLKSHANIIIPLYMLIVCIYCY